MSSSDFSRRKLLLDTGAGFRCMALSMLQQGEARAAGSDRAIKQAPHCRPKVKRFVQMFCGGRMSHLHALDYKPELSRRNGQAFNMPTFFGQAGNLMGGVFDF